MKIPRIPNLVAAALLVAGPAFALPASAGMAETPPAAAAARAEAAALPAWDQLSEAQREALLAPLRDRWNENPGKRARMLAHAQRWQEMGPEERARARRGADRWRDMEPEKREAMRALYARMKELPEAERQALRARWKDMSAEERRAWVQANPPPPAARPQR